MFLTDDTELQTTFRQKMTQADDVCTLTVAGVTTKMVGRYRCVATNVAGTAECAAIVTAVGSSLSAVFFPPELLLKSQLISTVTSIFFLPVSPTRRGWRSLL